MFQKIRLAKQNPEMEIHEIVADLKNKIDLTREERKKKIDDESQRLIDELDELERTCLANSTAIDIIKSSSKLESLLVRSENEFATLKKELSLYERKPDMVWMLTKAQCMTKERCLFFEYEKLKEDIFFNRLLEYELKQIKYCLNGVDYILYVFILIFIFNN